jgi:hypothetical protein
MTQPNRTRQHDGGKQRQTIAVAKELATWGAGLPGCSTGITAALANREIPGLQKIELEIMARRIAMLFHAIGETFTVHLAAIPARNADSGEQIPMKAAVATPRRVRIVEDNDDAREMPSILLTQHGHDVHMANDGPSGLRAALTFGRMLACST